MRHDPLTLLAFSESHQSITEVTQFWTTRFPRLDLACITRPQPMLARVGYHRVLATSIRPPKGAMLELYTLTGLLRIPSIAIPPIRSPALRPLFHNPGDCAFTANDQAVALKARSGR